MGHSSHHVKGIEVYNGKMIAYGAGDFLNDYEGIVGQGYEDFRDDLCCLYVPTLDTIYVRKFDQARTYSRKNQELKGATTDGSE